MLFIIIGNIISFIAALFMGLASWSRDIKRVYIYQAIECTLLSIASIFFSSWSGIASLLLCAVRNMLSAYNKLTKNILIIMLVILVFIGLFINNRGAIGWIAVAATMLYTFGACFFHNELLIKINILINLVLWIIYDIIIMDFSSCGMDSIVLIVTIFAILRVLKTVPKSN